MKRCRVTIFAKWFRIDAGLGFDLVVRETPDFIAEIQLHPFLNLDELVLGYPVVTDCKPSVTQTVRGLISTIQIGSRPGTMTQRHHRLESWVLDLLLGILSVLLNDELCLLEGSGRNLYHQNTQPLYSVMQHRFTKSQEVTSSSNT
jgi:hypothetical protein